jgi:hypothetical protein
MFTKAALPSQLFLDGGSAVHCHWGSAALLLATPILQAYAYSSFNSLGTQATINYGGNP